jgi:DNA repair protein RecO (recombination protein O)
MGSRFGSSLEPLTEVTLSYFHKEGRELVSVSSCEILNSHFDRAARDVPTASAFSYIAELLTEFSPDHEANERLYRLVRATLQAIEDQHSVSILVRYFESWLLRLTGFFPETTQCATCNEMIGDTENLFLGSDGAPGCVRCSGGRGTTLEFELRETLHLMFRSHPSAFAQTSPPLRQIARIGEINYQIIRHALERDLRSRGLLKQLGAM